MYYKHGKSRTKAYESWKGANRRCSVPTDSQYKHYGARGIAVCSRWLDFENFLQDMGPRPSGMTLERKDNLLGYSPDNCKWATYLEQTENRRITRRLTAFGKTLTLTQWSKEIGVPYATILKRVERLERRTGGYEPEQALRGHYRSLSVTSHPDRDPR